MSGRRWLAVVGILAVVGGIEVYVWLSGSSSAKTPPIPTFDPLEYFPHLEPGDEVPGFVAERLEGGTLPIHYPADGKATLFFMLSPTCGSCLKTLPKWNRLYRETTSQVRVFGMVIASYQAEQALLEDKPLEFPALRFPSEEWVQKYKVNKVPQTILVAPNGRVEENIQGELADSQVEDLLARIRREPVEPSS